MEIFKCTIQDQPDIAKNRMGSIITVVSSMKLRWSFGMEHLKRTLDVLVHLNVVQRFSYREAP
jgi:hypothetical protein